MEIFPALNKSDVDRNPIKQFAKWYGEASAAGIPETDAMTLATATKDGRPSARIVLLKAFDDRGFVFFTNYESRKAQDLAENPRACLVAYWLPVKRQVRIEGSVEQVSEEESETYFQRRPLGSRIGAWASHQSAVLARRADLEQRLRELEARFLGDPPLPPHWGGYRVTPEEVELWQGREDRLHDRVRYRREGESWKIERLSP